MVDSRLTCDLSLTWACAWLVECYNSDDDDNDDDAKHCFANAMKSSPSVQIS